MADIGEEAEGAVESDLPPPCPPSCVHRHAYDSVRHTRSVTVSVLRELHHHGDHPVPRDPHLAAVYRPLHVRVRGGPEHRWWRAFWGWGAGTWEWGAGAWGWGAG